MKNQLEMLHASKVFKQWNLWQSHLKNEKVTKWFLLEFIKFSSNNIFCKIFCKQWNKSISDKINQFLPYPKKRKQAKQISSKKYIKCSCTSIECKSFLSNQNTTQLFLYNKLTISNKNIDNFWLNIITFDNFLFTQKLYCENFFKNAWNVFLTRTTPFCPYHREQKKK